ncbi:hypothetical protein Dsin_032232 [Dipteronia sinensis]|uniref:Uncharacterized protein n=1 Tax=Dipteronia sinensis TaxID=43782 RepID=A0AAD9ZMU4_9ROSI|nr:hypothetical protein Dsin_032232 [Dipteronia sinensis]
MYVTMFTSGVTLPIQPFIARFMKDIGIAPAQLSPNSYRMLVSLWHLWEWIGANHPPTPQEIHKFYTFNGTDAGGIFHLQSSFLDRWIPKEFDERPYPASSKEPKGFIWGFSTSNKYWKNSWLFVRGNWGKTIVADPHQDLTRNSVSRHFCNLEIWNKTPIMLTKR